MIEPDAEPTRDSGVDRSAPAQHGDPPSSPAADEDSALIRSALSGETQAFRRLIEKHQAPVYDLCLRVLGDPAEAEDAAQETFLKFHSHMGRYIAGGKLSNWLYTIALNTARNILRRRRIARFFSLDSGLASEEGSQIELPSPEPEPGRRIEEIEEEALLERQIASLPDALRGPFVLRYLKQIPETEIASMLGLSIANVRVRLHRARMSLWRSRRAGA